jgi:hypothetical protein
MNELAQTLTFDYCMFYYKFDNQIVQHTSPSKTTKQKIVWGNQIIRRKKDNKHVSTCERCSSLRRWALHSTTRTTHKWLYYISNFNVSITFGRWICFQIPCNLRTTSYNKWNTMGWSTNYNLGWLLGVL